MYNNRPWSDLKDIAWWDRPPRTRPVPAARPPRPARPRIYSRRTRRCRLPGIVRTGCFSPWGEAASVSHASPGMCGTGPMRSRVDPSVSVPRAEGTERRYCVHLSAERCGCYLSPSDGISTTHSCRAHKNPDWNGNGITHHGYAVTRCFRILWCNDGILQFIRYA